MKNQTSDQCLACKGVGAYYGEGIPQSSVLTFCSCPLGKIQKQIKALDEEIKEHEKNKTALYFDMKRVHNYVLEATEKISELRRQLWKI